MTPLLLLLLLALLVWFWQVSQRSREIAIQVARQTCSRQGVQFLDGTASLKRIWPGWSRSNGPGFSRIYHFEYSEDGLGRQSGCIIMFNAHIQSVVLDERDM